MKDWKESNINLIKDLNKILVQIASNYQISASCCLFLVQYVVEKSTDAKFNENAINILKPLGSKLHPYSMTITLLECIDMKKPPIK